MYKGKPLEYSANAKDPKKRVIYFDIVQDLNAGEPIMSIVKKYGVSRNLVYRIRKELKNGEHKKLVFSFFVLEIEVLSGVSS